ncbi:MAG: exonuclease domain-containing protein [Saprospiraceae bacterium]
MREKLYAIIDVETTGGRAARDRITEIAVVVHDGTKVVDTFESLVNPETRIPYGITQLTGISQEMVDDAPKFYEIARKIVELTEGAVFVAHNVRFDYSFIREEFKRLGFTFTRKQLCTVRLSRKAFPGLPSYSLGKLIKHFGINVNDRHRAMADTMATVELFEKILNKEDGGATAEEMINLGIKEALLPKNVSLEIMHALPEECGVYYMHDEEGRCVYVGKSINIKKRVAQHFSKKTEKASKFQRFVHDITYEITGSELAALLLESHEIKTLRPYINRAQRRRYFPYVIHTFTNEEGYVCFDVDKPTAAKRKKLNVVAEYTKVTGAKGRLKYALENYELCGKFCNLDTGTTACFNFHLKQCRGGCVGQEAAEEYNERAAEVIERFATVFDEDFCIIDVGRNEQEQSIVLVEDGEYKGYGYVDKDGFYGSAEEIRDAVKMYAGNPETSRIIRHFLSKNPRTRVINMANLVG